MRKMKQKTDEELMLMWTAGNLKAFEALFNRYGQKVYNLFLRSLGQKETSEDLLQECFMRLAESRNRYHPQNSFTSWLFTIAMNLLRDQYRKKRRFLATFNPEDPEPTLQNFADSGNEPLKQMETDELRATVERALQTLPADQREIIVLSKYQGLSYAEISDILALSPEAAKQKAYRGLKALREKLGHLSEGQ